MFKSKKMIAMLLAMTFMAACAGPTLQMARAYDGGVVIQGAGPTEPGTESIIAHDRVKKEDVQQLTNYGAMVKIAETLMGVSGAASFSDNTAKNYIAQGIVTGIIEKIAPTHKTVTIIFDRYILRGADGKRYYKVYASYYQPDGKFISAHLVQCGIDG